MNKKLTIVGVLLIAASMTGLANILPAGKDCKEFNVGVTGILADIRGGVLRVTTVRAKTPADGKLQKGDELITVNGESLEIQDPRQPLGFAINKAEGKDGKMTFSIRRDGSKQDVNIQLKMIGSYGPKFPINCQKSKRIVDETAEFIIESGGPKGGITGDLEALFLLSTGEDKYIDAVKDYARKSAAGKISTSTWYLGYSGIFLGEYYLATGDKQVLPAIKARCDQLSAGQYFGGWGHSANRCGPGYVTGGVLNAAGDQALTTLILARECGVKVDEHCYNKALRFFFRFAGRGGVPYGDHHPELWPSSNGKNGGLASALTLLPGKKFQGGAQLLALSETDSYFDSESGHGSTFANQAWRNIVDVIIPEEHEKSYRRHKQQMIWHFELSRMPGGGFRVPWYPGHGVIGRAPLYQTGLIAMGYTAHLKQLRICGKPRTKHSVPHQPTAVEMSLETDDFHRTDWVDGVVAEEDPHKIAAAFLTLYNDKGNKLPRKGNASKNDARKKAMPVEWYSKMMHHYSPTVRAWAAIGLGFQGEAAIPEIKKALASKDDRLRVAGLNAISCVTGWGIGTTTSKITQEMIKANFLPQIIAPLKDPQAPMWEKRHALIALSRCDAKTIEKNLDAVVPYLNNEEWWLRAAAFAVMHPLIPETKTFREFLPLMLESYDKDTNLPSRRWGATKLFKKAIAANEDLKDEIIEGMAASLNRMKVRHGFKQPIDRNNIFETLRYVDMQRHPENAILLLPAIESIYPIMEPLPAMWTIIGARWGNIGLAKAAEKLGKDGRPFVQSMKRIQPILEAKPKNGKHGKSYTKALEVLKKAVKDWEEKHGADGT